MMMMMLASLISLMFCGCIVLSEGELQIGFYQGSCGFAELAVKQEVRNAFMRDNGIAAGLIRLHFHDCFVRVRNCFFLKIVVLYILTACIV